MSSKTILPKLVIVSSTTIVIRLKLLTCAELNKEINSFKYVDIFIHRGTNNNVRVRVKVTL